MKIRKFTLATCLFLAAASTTVTAAVIAFSSEGFGNMHATSDNDSPVLTRQDGYVIRFKANPNADYYKIHDETDYKNGLELTNENADDNGYIYYETETVGVHNVSVTAYVDGEPHESNTITVTNKPVLFYGEQSNLYFYDVEGLNRENTYSILQKDGTWVNVSQTQFNETYNKTLVDPNTGFDAIDFSAPEYVYETINSQKQAGANVLFLSSRTSYIESDVRRGDPQYECLMTYLK